MVSNRIKDSNVDRISNLPDAILCHILSFLPTKDSVRTRVISTRWKHLFSLVPVLDFCNLSSSSHDRNLDFQNFVDRVFNSYNVHQMDTFRYISFGEHPEASRLASWISESVHRRVQKLEIEEYLFMPQWMPCDIFTCKTLTYLSLKGRFHVQVPEDAYLPRLRILSLAVLSFIDSVSAHKLFQSCPLLEKLVLCCCHTGNIQSFDISIPSLKILTIIHGPGERFDLVLDVPNVEEFNYVGVSVDHGSYTVKDLKLVAKVYISTTARSNEGRTALMKLARAIRNVRHLNINDSTLKALQRSTVLLPVFCNLTYLEIRLISCSNSELILNFLDRTPHLQVLVVNNVEFKGFSMLEKEIKIVEYFLKNAKILEMLKIQVRGSLGSSDKQFEMRNKLMSFSRYSRACEIVLVSNMGET